MFCKKSEDADADLGRDARSWSTRDFAKWKDDRANYTLTQNSRIFSRRKPFKFHAELIPKADPASFADIRSEQSEGTCTSAFAIICQAFAILLFTSVWKREEVYEIRNNKMSSWLFTVPAGMRVSQAMFFLRQPVCSSDAPCGEKHVQSVRWCCEENILQMHAKSSPFRKIVLSLHSDRFETPWGYESLVCWLRFSHLFNRQD